jgi:hypothetical protein
MEEYASQLTPSSREEEQWIPVNIALPETDFQHGEQFLSEEVAVWTMEGFMSDRYSRTYDLRGGTHRLISEGWSYNGNDVTHWKKVLPPK